MPQQDFHVRSIGVIRSPFVEAEGMPIQTTRSEAEGAVEIYKEYAEGLADVETFSHVFLLYVFDRAGEPRLTVTPFLDDSPHGLFSTRYPARPNPIGLSVVEIIARDGCTLYVRGVDVLDGTPLLDIKPYIPQFDHHPVTRMGWLTGQEDNRPWEARYED
jgi:tRNA-Thr(GGU) m(6)t(6)A37 methyltransferase TsaA